MKKYATRMQYLVLQTCTNAYKLKFDYIRLYSLWEGGTILQIGYNDKQ